MSEYESAARLSDDGAYRYDLTRRWRPGDLMLWIMLNPSTADANADDPTIRRCIGYAKREDCAGIVVVNLYAYRTTRPAHLLEVADPIGPVNVVTIRRWLQSGEVALVVAGWGAWWDGLRWEHKIARPAVESFAAQAARELLCLGHTVSGAPRHPLYAPAIAPLIPWKPRP